MNIMTEWIDKLGDYLAEKRPDRFRLTPEKHWEIKREEEWIKLPDHYVSGFVLIMLGLVATKTNNSLTKAIGLLTSLFGAYLVMDDLKDLIEDIKKFFDSSN